MSTIGYADPNNWASNIMVTQNLKVGIKKLKFIHLEVRADNPTNPLVENF